MIETRDLHYRYTATATEGEVLRGIDLRIDAGEFVALMGPSGCGKSTLLHIVGLITLPTRAKSLRLHDVETIGLSDAQRTRLRNQNIGFVFQRFNLLPVLSAADNIRLALRLKGHSINGEAERLLGAVGLEAFAKRKPSQLSIGQQQRVAIARAVAAEPAILLADEPTGSLDSDNADAILDLLAGFHRDRGITIILATHNEAVAARADRVLSMKDGVVRER